jgi:hypothetical protein
MRHRHLAFPRGATAILVALILAFIGPQPIIAATVGPCGADETNFSGNIMGDGVRFGALAEFPFESTDQFQICVAAQSYGASSAWVALQHISGGRLIFQVGLVRCPIGCGSDFSDGLVHYFWA